MACAVSWLLVLLVAVLHADAEPLNEEQFLVNEILNLNKYGAGGYSKETRPMKNFTQAVEVTLQVDVFGILGLDSKEQILTASTAFVMNWQDDRLRWDDRAEFDGVEHICVPATSVWHPPIEVLNAIGETKLVTESTKVLITREGVLHVAHSLIQKSQCYMRQGKFPFDQQSCYFIMGTMNIPSGMVLIKASKADTPRDQVRSVENWDFVDLEVTGTLSPSCITMEDADKCQRTSQALVNITLKREPGFYLYTVFVPCSILTILASVIFWLPPECGEKLSFGISIFFGFVVFQLIVQDALVEAGNGKPSILIRFVLFNFVLVGLAVLVTACTIALYHKGGPEETARGSAVPGEGCLEVHADDIPIKEACDEDNRKNQGTKKPRDWRKIARFVNRICFVLYYIAFTALICVLFAELVQL